MTLKHLDLFSGIAGFALAARWMNWETVAFCEKDKFCQTRIRKNFPGVPIYDDIIQFNGTRYRGQCDIITGGFPCQPFSSAGKKQGDQDDRFLWPETMRVVKEAQPSIIVFENVAGLFTILESGSISEVEAQEVKLFCEDEGREATAVIERIQRRIIARIIEDLTQAGYELPQLADGTPIIPVIPACAVGAPHRRDRVWIIGYAQHSRLDAAQVRESGLTGSNGNATGANEICEPSGSGLPRATTANNYSRGSAAFRANEEQGRSAESFGRDCADATDTDFARMERRTLTGSDSRNGAQSNDEHIRRCEIASPSNADRKREPQSQRIISKIRRRAGNTSATSFDAASAGFPNWAGGTFRQPHPLTEFERSDVPLPRTRNQRKLAQQLAHDGWARRVAANHHRKYWRETERYFRGLDARIPSRLVRDRVSKLKALGNAIVPQVAYEIFKAIETAILEET